MCNGTVKMINELQGNLNRIRYIAFSSDDAHYATSSSDGNVRIYDTNSSQELTVIRDIFKIIYSMTFSNDGKYLAVGSCNGIVRIYDTKSFQELTIIRGRNEVLNLAFSPNNKYLATGCSNGTTQLWDASTFQLITVLRDRSMSFSSDGKYLATVSNYGSKMRIYDASTFQELTCFQSCGFHSSFSSHVKYLAIASFNGNVKIYDMSTFQAISIINCHSQWIRSVHFLKDDKYLAIVFSDASIQIFNTSTFQEVTFLRDHIVKEVASIAFSNDGKYLATGGFGCAPLLWDIDELIKKNTLTIKEI